jgi:hypothetical protein
MRVFISWSGDGARDFALFLRIWLRQVVQALQPFMSEQDIGKGTRNTHEMGKVLEDTQFGIVVLTRDNVAAPWINFEAGAISKSLGTSRLVPLLLDVAKSDVAGPLAQFQAVDANDHTDIHRMFQDINTLLEHPLDAEVLGPAVQSKLPEFEAAVYEYRTGTLGQGAAGALRSDRDVMEEILLIVRDWRSVPPKFTVPLAIAPAVDWRDQLRRLEEDLADGKISAAQYRRLRDDMLAGTTSREQGDPPP